MQRKNSTGNDEHDDFARGDAGASLTFPQQCSTLRKGGHVIIKDRPCKIVDIHSSKVGKHGHAKVMITGLDIFTDRRYQTMHPSSHNMDVPIVTRTDYLLVDSGTFLSLMDEKGYLRTDIRCPDGDLGDIVQTKLASDADEAIAVTVLSAMGEEMVLEVKTGRE
ncbi:eukaryotic translation initiation factor 5a [Plakobranchus ocellatus]|uniref:Eukaryotic translation initiation factor 5A n=1 Tax=Plakobranchus ocellatus TaxID=259542 RepID=A0AAV3Y175_9GAST|nr:eukaryotic translation initiation factor 5a [Plakobranchus ocellatus]